MHSADCYWQATELLSTFNIMYLTDISFISSYICRTINRTRQDGDQTGPKPKQAADPRSGSGLSHSDAPTWAGLRIDDWHVLFRTCTISRHKQATVSNYLPSIFHNQSCQHAADRRQSRNTETRRGTHHMGGIITGCWGDEEETEILGSRLRVYLFKSKLKAVFLSLCCKSALGLCERSFK